MLGASAALICLYSTLSLYVVLFSAVIPFVSRALEAFFLPAVSVTHAYFF